MNPGLCLLLSALSLALIRVLAALAKHACRGALAPTSEPAPVDAPDDSSPTDPGPHRHVRRRLGADDQGREVWHCIVTGCTWREIDGKVAKQP